MTRMTNTAPKTPFFLCPALFLLISVLCFAGCTSRTGVPDTTIDFSQHTDGSRITAEELSAYQQSVLDTLVITEQGSDLTGTHTGLFSTVVSITLYQTTDKDLLKSCFSLLAEYETILSRTMPGSELYAVNHNTSGFMELSDDLAQVIALGLQYKELSNGMFDITTAPLSDLWAFGSNTSVPEDQKLQEALSKVNSSLVSLHGTTLTYPAGTGFDLGALAKGWLADRLAAYLTEQGIQSAMINLGGNVLALGEKPDGSAYRVGITLPFSGSSELAGILSLKNRSVVTSGIYERFFIQDDTLYHHLLDATTGYPVENDLLSVTIVCESSALADILATVCFLLGHEDGLTLINQLRSHTDVAALFLSGTYRIETRQVEHLQYHFSEGFEELFQPN